MATPATPEERRLVSEAIRLTLAYVPTSTLRTLADLEDEIARANMVGGLSWQVKANTELLNAVDKAAGKLSDFYIKEIAGHLEKASDYSQKKRR